MSRKRQFYQPTYHFPFITGSSFIVRRCQLGEPRSALTMIESIQAQGNFYFLKGSVITKSSVIDALIGRGNGHAASEGGGGLKESKDLTSASSGSSRQSNKSMWRNPPHFWSSLRIFPSLIHVPADNKVGNLRYYVAWPCWAYFGGLSAKKRIHTRIYAGFGVVCASLSRSRSPGA